MLFVGNLKFCSDLLPLLQKNKTKQTWFQKSKTEKKKKNKLGRFSFLLSFDISFLKQPKSKE